MSWLDLLVQAVERHPGGQLGVAAELGVSRTTVSLVVAGKYPAKTDRIEQKVLAHYSTVLCPHLQVAIKVADCHAFATRSAPTSSPREMRHWRACQKCPHRPGAGNQAPASAPAKAPSPQGALELDEEPA